MTAEFSLPAFTLFFGALIALAWIMNTMYGFVGVNEENEGLTQVNFGGSKIKRLINKAVVWNNNRIAIRDLNAMSDWVLNDLGIERYEIEDKVRLSASKPIRLHTAAKPSTVEMLKYAA